MAEENQRIASATSDNDEKKIIRREVERQRRTQMSILCASLRSSLPSELIKVFNFCYLISLLLVIIIITVMSHMLF